MEKRSDTNLSVTEQRQEAWESGEWHSMLAKQAFAPGIVELFLQIQKTWMQIVSGLEAFIKSKEGQALFNELRSFAEHFKATQAQYNEQQLAKKMEELSDSPLKNYLTSRSNAEIADIIARSKPDVLPTFDTSVMFANTEYEQRIVQSLEEGKIDALTTGQRGYLTYFIFFVVLAYQTLTNWNSVREGICDINARLAPTTSVAEVRKIVRTRLCGIPAWQTKIVKADGVNLRDGPGMKNAVLIQLRKGLVVGVINNDNRNWVEVSFDLDGHVVEGWVSRKFLKSLQ